MDLQEAYSFLFVDSILSALIVPIQEPLVYDAMKIFGGYNLYLAFFIALAGSLIGSLGNWVLGRMILSCERKAIIQERSARLIAIGRLAKKPYGRLFLLLTPFPVFGPFFPIFAAFFEIPLLLTILLVSVAQSVWLLV